MTRPPICTCRWTTVNSASVDPPALLDRDPECPVHSCTYCGAEVLQGDDVCHECHAQIKQDEWEDWFGD
jgi:hypothetical protein